MSAPYQKVPQSFVSELPDSLRCYKLVGQDRYGCAPYCFASAFPYSGQRVVSGAQDADDDPIQCVCCLVPGAGTPPPLPPSEETADSSGLWQMFRLPSMPAKTYEPSEDTNGTTVVSRPAVGESNAMSGWDVDVHAYICVIAELRLAGFQNFLEQSENGSFGHGVAPEVCTATSSELLILDS